MKNKKLNNIFSYVKGRKNAGVADEFLLKYFNDKYFIELFKKDTKLIFRNRKFKNKVKEIRKKLYKIHGVFQRKNQGKKEILLKELKNAKNIKEAKKISKEILKLHSSTRERLEEYEKIYASIFNITGMPDKVIDLGCGLNPIFFILLGFNGAYFGYDISSRDADFLNDYFKIVKKYGIDGKAFSMDIKKDFNYPKADVCFLFKILDLFGRGRKVFFSRLINNINARFIAASFSKKTISLKDMNKPERMWFINFLNKLGLEYKILDFENECFFVVRLK